MNEIIENQETNLDFEQAVLHSENQRRKNRRMEPCEGFTYISTVGWMCRREIIRRKELERPQ